MSTIKEAVQANPRLLTGSETAEILRVSPKTLENWRSSGRYPLAYIKIGGRVMYELSSLREFIENRTIRFRKRGNARLRAKPVETPRARKTSKPDR